MKVRHCVFCERKNFEERIITETSSLYFVASLGQITNGGYTLIIPKKHTPCVGMASEGEVLEIEDMAVVASYAIYKEYGIMPLIFEHGIVGQAIPHAHLHLMPANIFLGDRIKKDFPKATRGLFASLQAFRKAYVRIQKNYLLWNIPVEKRNLLPLGLLCVVWNPPAPVQYLRLITAKLLGRPERANWRSMNQKLDRELWSSTMMRLAPYFQ